jgi:diaminopimelate epimerase
VTDPDLLLKVEGAGNDFVLGTGAWAVRIRGDSDLVTRLCDRRRGIGGDGALAVASDGPDRLHLTYRNRDGSVAAFCANATRCAARVGVELLGQEPALLVHTAWVVVPARVTLRSVALDLPPPRFEPRSLTVSVGGAARPGWFLTVGVPHLVVPVDDPDLLDLAAVAPPLRHLPNLGPDGANVNFVRLQPDGVLAVRSWERGVEGETLACGSGVVAAALVTLAGSDRRGLDCRPRSGDLLRVEALGEPPCCPARLTGPARIVARLEPTPELLG